MNIKNITNIILVIVICLLSAYLRFNPKCVLENFCQLNINSEIP